METVMNIKDILQCLPHRYPFLLIDRVVQFEKGQSLVAIKNMTMNESFFQGHFPNTPVMPGVLMLEALAQAAVVLAVKSTTEILTPDTLFLFAGIDDVRFRRLVVPGDQLRLQVDVIRGKRDLWKIKGEASVEGEIACTAELLCVRKEGSL